MGVNRTVLIIDSVESLDFVYAQPHLRQSLQGATLLYSGSSLPEFYGPLFEQIIYLTTGSEFNQHTVILSYLRSFTPTQIYCDSDILLEHPQNIAVPITKLQRDAQTHSLLKYLHFYHALLPVNKAGAALFIRYPLLSLLHPEAGAANKILSDNNKNTASDLNVLNAALRLGLLAQHATEKLMIPWAPESITARNQALDIDFKTGAVTALLTLLSGSGHERQVLQAALTETSLNCLVVITHEAYLQQAEALITELSALTDETQMDIILFTYKQCQDNFQTLLENVDCVLGVYNTELHWFSETSKRPFFSFKSDLHKEAYLNADTNMLKLELFEAVKPAQIQANQSYRQLLEHIIRQPDDFGLCAETLIQKTPFALTATNPHYVSVIIPCYNYAVFLTEAVESVIAQTYPLFEIIIVNDGSTDHTVEICNTLLEKHPHIPITVMHQPNSGDPAVARNMGITHAKGQYVLCLDADDKLNPDFLAACIETFTYNPRISIVYPCLQEFGGQQSFWGETPYDFQLLLHWNYIPTASMFYKHVWQNVGGIKTDVIICEDWDFWISSGELGYFGKQTNQAILYHRVHSDTSLLSSQGGLDKRTAIKAEIILMHPTLYTHRQRQWALAIRTNEKHLALPEVDISWMPLFHKDQMPTAVMQQALLHAKAQKSAFAYLIEHRNYTQTEPQFWGYKNNQWQQSSLPDRILDWTPATPLSASAEIIWAPTSQAVKILQQERPHNNVHLLPRLCHTQHLTGEKTALDVEKNNLLLGVFSVSDSPWQQVLKAYLSLYTQADDWAFIVLFLNTDTETAFDHLSAWLSEQDIVESEQPEIIILDANDFQEPSKLLQLCPKLLFCEPACDPSGTLWLKAMQSQIPIIFSETVPVEYQDWLTPLPNPGFAIDQPHQAYTSQKRFEIEWNKNIYNTMMQFV